MSRAHHRRRPALDADELLGLLAPVEHAALVGFAPTRRHVDVHLLDLPVDDRAASAGLFGLVAPPEWDAVGLVLAGRGRSLVTGQVVAPGVLARVVLTRRADLASEVLFAADAPPVALPGATDSIDSTDSIGGEGPSGDAGLGTAEGVAVDALHRLLGLRCPGRAPQLSGVVASIWLDEVLEHVLDLGPIDWPTAVALHPGDLGASSLPPSTEALVEATVRAADELDWDRLRRRAASGAYRAADLSPLDAAWMDEVMFGRWVVASLPDRSTVLEVLRSTGSGDAADGLALVLAALGRRGPSQPHVTTR